MLIEGLVYQWQLVIYQLPVCVWAFIPGHHITLLSMYWCRNGNAIASSGLKALVCGMENNTSLVCVQGFLEYKYRWESCADSGDFEEY